MPRTYKAQVKMTQFNQKSLVKITKSYHNQVCPEYSCIDYTKSLNKKIWIEPRIGISQYSYVIKEGDNINFQGLRPELFIKYEFPRINYLWNLKVGVNYASYKFDDYITSPLETSPNTHIYAHNTNVGIPVMLEFSFPTRLIKPYINLGIQSTFIKNKDLVIMRKSESRFERSTIINKGDKVIQIDSRFGAGVRYEFRNFNYLSLDLDYSNMLVASFLNSKSVDSKDYKSQTFSISLGYGFKVK